MEYELKPCKVVTTFETYEECAKYMMKEGAQNTAQAKQSYRFEKYFVQILREHPVLYDEKHRQFGNEFPTKHAWSIVAGYMMMESKDVHEIWKTFQKFARSGVPLYVDLVNYVKLGDGNGWIDVDPSERDTDDSAIKKEDDGNSSIEREDEICSSIKKEGEGRCSIKREDSFHIEEEVTQSIKMEIQ